MLNSNWGLGTYINSGVILHITTLPATPITPQTPTNASESHLIALKQSLT
jgi:hypothetical protein